MRALTIADPVSVPEWPATGPSKVTSLTAAVSEHVHAGDTLYFGGSMARPIAALYEVVRQHWGTSPGFTVAAPTFTNQHVPLVHGRLAAKVITAFHGTTYPSPGPNRVFTQAADSGEVSFEEWTLLTLTLRTIAGAMGLPFLPTRSILGTDIEANLTEAGQFQRIADPFSGTDIGVIPALHPDVTFIHALAADPSGNAIISPPYYEGTWAAQASRRAVIVTAERIVPPEFVRRYSHLAAVPGQAVTAVCHAPFGAHPSGAPGDPVPEVGGYADDYAAMDELAEASRTDAALDAWIEKWITGIGDHRDYLATMGPERAMYLRGRTHADGWLVEEPAARANREARLADVPSRGERLAAFGARLVAERLGRAELDVALAGLGISTLAAWLGTRAARERGESADLLVEAGMAGFTPAPLDPFIFNYRNTFTSTSLTDILRVLGVAVGGHRNRALGVLSAAEVDRRGYLNTTRARGSLLTGSGGANDIASGARDVVVTVPHSPRRLVEAVDYRTSPAHQVSAVVTDRALLVRGADGELELGGVFADGAQSRDELVAAAVAGCGWALKPRGVVPVFDDISAAERTAIAAYDPAGLFVGGKK